MKILKDRTEEIAKAEALVDELHKEQEAFESLSDRERVAMILIEQRQKQDAYSSVSRAAAMHEPTVSEFLKAADEYLELGDVDTVYAVLKKVYHA